MADVSHPHQKTASRIGPLLRAARSVANRHRREQSDEQKNACPWRCLPRGACGVCQSTEPGRISGAATPARPGADCHLPTVKRARRGFETADNCQRFIDRVSGEWRSACPKRPAGGAFRSGVDAITGRLNLRDGSCGRRRNRLRPRRSSLRMANGSTKTGQRFGVTGTIRIVTDVTPTKPLTLLNKSHDGLDVEGESVIQRLF